MTWPVREARWADGDMLAPHQVQAAWLPIVGVLNGQVDRDNIQAGALGPAQVAAGAWASRRLDTGNETLTAPATSLGILWRTVAELEFVADDGCIVVHAGATLWRTESVA